MSKRNPNFRRRKRDAYDTPLEAVLPLLPHLKAGCRYAEPCAGRGLLIKNLAANGVRFSYAGDIKPRASSIIEKRDALTLTGAVLKGADLLITNPPHTRKFMHPLIYHFLSLRPSWLLIDADWMHTKQAGELITRCAKIVSIGRVKWITRSKHTGYDNMFWYYFTQRHHTGPVFIGRTKKKDLRNVEISAE